MLWPAGKRSLGVYALLFGGAAAVCGWQQVEHRRFERAASAALINRGRDITTTLGIVVRAQRRGGIVPRDRMVAALQDLVRPGDLESIAILGATGEPIAQAGQPVSLTPEMLRARGVHWQNGTLTLMNLMDLGAHPPEDPARPPAAIVVEDPRPYRPTLRRAAETFGRPGWMSPEEYDAVIQKQGVHSLLVSLSTAGMHRAVRNDLLLRALVSVLAAAAALVAALAWRNRRKTSDLRIRLLKAGEMNTHLSEINLAAAGLAHETRNPLNLIRGLAQMIALEAPAAPKLREHAAAIVEEADRVTVQLNEFIHYAKPREAHPAPVDLPRLVAEVARTLQPDLEEKGVDIRIQDTPLSVGADEPLFRQALFNLLLNAVQAVGPAGRIDVRWTTAGPRGAVLEVADDGPGVPAADRAAIFKPYVTMRPKGVGLGLAIVQQIVSAHGWTVVCAENSPRGAVFRLAGLKLAGPVPGGSA
jgi:signal transduction histidine kinase